VTRQREGGKQSPDSVIADYLDDLLSVSDDYKAYLDAEDLERAAEQDRSPGPERRHSPEPARAPQPAPEVRRETRLAERPAINMNLVSPAFRRAAEEAPPVAESALAPPTVEQIVETTAPEPVAKAPEPIVEKPAPVAETPEPVLETPVSAPEADTWQNGRPVWAQQGFECLIFRVAGLQLAVPLILLGAVHRLEDELTPLFGRPDWYMGLLKEGNQNISVADTARWVMPDRYPADCRDNYHFVIRLGDTHWGLACDEVAKSFTVQPDEVKWRTTRSRRKWLAGTIREQMCALLDVSELAYMLGEAEQGKPLDMRG